MRWRDTIGKLINETIEIFLTENANDARNGLLALWLLFAAFVAPAIMIVLGLLGFKDAAVFVANVGVGAGTMVVLSVVLVVFAAYAENSRESERRAEERRLKEQEKQSETKEP